LPRRWRDQLAVKEAELWLSESDASVRIERVQAGRRQSLAELQVTPEQLPTEFDGVIGEEQRDLRRVLLLPRERVLLRRLSLPPVTADKLRTVLGFEIDRQTPFRADQVYYDCRLLAPAAAGRPLTVEMALVPRDALQHMLAPLGTLATQLDAVDVADGDARFGYNFLPEDRRRRRDHRQILINLLLVVGSVVLLLLAMSQLVDNRLLAVDGMKAEIEKQRTAARGVGQLRTQLDDAVEAANFLDVQKRRQPSMLQVLEQMTELLPDDTFLERLSITGSTLSITGQSGQAGSLIERLQASATFCEPALAGPIQPDARSGKDRFTITAQLCAAQQEAPDAAAAGR
jgi:general secretion pathway protein L